MKLTYNMSIPKCVLCGSELSLQAMYTRCSTICYTCEVARLKKTVDALKERWFPKKAS